MHYYLSAGKFNTDWNRSSEVLTMVLRNFNEHEKNNIYSPFNDDKCVDLRPGHYP